MPASPFKVVPRLRLRSQCRQSTRDQRCSRRIERDSTDAVNGGQVYEMQQVWMTAGRKPTAASVTKIAESMAWGAQMGAMTQMATAAQNGGLPSAR